MCASPQKKETKAKHINELFASYLYLYANLMPSSKQLHMKSFMLPIKINVRTPPGTCSLHTAQRTLYKRNALIYMHVNRISPENHMHALLFIYRSKQRLKIYPSFFSFCKFFKSFSVSVLKTASKNIAKKSIIP